MRKIAKWRTDRGPEHRFQMIPMAIGPRMMREVREAVPAGFIKKDCKCNFNHACFEYKM